MGDKASVRFEIDESVLEEFDQIHENRSEGIRSLIRSEVARERPELKSETLAKAYGVLLEQGDRYENGAIRCVAPKVAPIIANHCNVDGGIDAVKGRIYPGLRKAGYIKPRAGFLWVKPQAADPKEWGDK